jgi:phosphatidate cytidylyltransferase
VSNFVQRLLTAVVAFPVLIAAIQWQRPLAVEIIVLGAAAIALREWVRMTIPAAPLVDKVFGVVAGLALLAFLAHFADVPMAGPAAIAFALIAAFVWFLFRHDPIEAVAARIAFVVTGWLYVMLVLFLLFMKQRPDGGAWVYLALTIAWGGDTGGYFAGRFLGPRFPRKLYEAVSPKKTVVGGVGGMLGAWLCVAAAKVYYVHYWGFELSWLDTLLIAIPANVLGQVGDLAESLVKRSVGVKDSGNLLPGHGGMLDRIDALIFVAPYVYCYARWSLGRF